MTTDFIGATITAFAFIMFAAIIVLHTIDALRCGHTPRGRDAG